MVKIHQSISPTGENSTDRKLLMLCYFFPPMRTTGITRSKEFVKYLPEFGWQPTVLTVKDPKDPWTTNFNEPVPEGVEVQRSRELNIPRLVRLFDGAREALFRLFGKHPTVNFFHDRLCIPDHYIGWLPYLKGIRLARTSECVYVSCSPFSAAITGVIIGLIARKPVILDFRDAWTLNPYMPHSKIHSTITRMQERWVLKNAKKVILNTCGAQDLYVKKYPEISHKFTYIPNGFDVLPTSANMNTDGDLFKIIHLGDFYGPRQPDELLEALAVINNPIIQFIQIGKSFESMDKFSDRVNIKMMAPLPHNEALELMQTASLLYLKQGQMPGVDYHIAVAAKTYEYIATGLPILAECPPGDNADIVREYASQSYQVMNENRSELVAAISDAYDRRKDMRPLVKPTYSEQFSRKYLTKQLIEVIEKD